MGISISPIQFFLLFVSPCNVAAATDGFVPVSIGCLLSPRANSNNPVICTRVRLA